MFKETKDGQTHSFGDGCEDEHGKPQCQLCNNIMKPAYDDIIGKISNHLWFCPCNPNIIISIG